MNYISTRSDLRVSDAEAIAAGLSPDGGLFLPETLPSFSLAEIEAMQALDYAGRAHAVLSRFLPSYTSKELADDIAAAYDSAKFPKAVAPVVSLPDNLHVLELFRGPTCAFKDFALQLLPHLLTAALQKTGVDKTAVILVATSGDTGKAALEGFADVEGTKICVFYPDGGTSDIQQLQMTTQSGNNVMVFAAAGNFDDAQSGVKAIFTDEAFAAEQKAQGYLLSSANSINWGRLVPQIAYYFFAYCDLCANGTLRYGEKLNVTVPTGNFGNILAAYLAKLCGLPLGKLVCASNRNHILTDFLSTGVYDKNRAFHLTSSPSMDILISSNLERLLYLLSDRSPTETAAYMRALTAEGRYTASPALLAKLQESFACGYADEEQTAKRIKAVFDRTAYLCDPHTAVAFHVADAYRQAHHDDTPMLIAATASPYKFADSVLPALGHVPQGDLFARLTQLHAVCGEPIPPSLEALAGKPTHFHRVLAPADMKQALAQWLDTPQASCPAR